MDLTCLLAKKKNMSGPTCQTHLLLSPVVFSSQTLTTPALEHMSIEPHHHVHGIVVGVDEPRGSARQSTRRINVKTTGLLRLLPGGHKLNTVEMLVPNVV